MFCSAVMCGKSAPPWKTRPILRFVGPIQFRSPATQPPSQWIGPLVGFSRPAIKRRSVVFPLPLSPTREMSSPLATVKEMSSTAGRSPLVYCFEMFRISSKMLVFQPEVNHAQSPNTECDDHKGRDCTVVDATFFGKAECMGRESFEAAWA